MPAGVQVETGEETADRSSEEIRENLSFLQTFLLVFGFIAVFVGSFIIFNTFSITVAQRVTEFGMLRTLGASRRQILASVLIEAVVIGLVGAIVGIGGGFVVALGCNALFEAFGIDLPTTGLVLETRTVIVSLLVGVVVTFVASLMPALRSTRVPPIAALHALHADPESAPTARRRRRSAVLLAAVGVALLVAGLLRRRRGRRAGREDRRRRAVVVIARLVLQPAVGAGSGRVAGWPLERVRRLTGRLSRENPSATRPHRGDRGGADDRAGAGHLRHRLRRRVEGHGRPGRR